MSGFRFCVAHLVWGPLGLSHLERFIESYRAHDAGHPHELVAIINNVDDRLRASARRVLADVPHRALVLESPALDIDAYRLVTTEIAADGYLFLNSYSRILAGGWAAHYVSALRAAGVGVVGAGGSYRSMREYNPWRPVHGPLPLYKLLPLYASTTLRCWETRLRFPAAPCPYVRTNAFAMTSETIGLVGWPACGSKRATWQFEAGRRNMTRRTQAIGRRCVLVDRSGRISDIPDWPTSNTYWSGAQQALLVADNRSDEYGRATPAERLEMARGNWPQR